MAEKKSKTLAIGPQVEVGYSNPNGAWNRSEGSKMPPKRRAKLAEPSPSFDWRLLMSGNQLGLLSLIISAVTILYSAGWIPSIAKQTDVSGLSQQIVEIKGAIDGLGKEFRESRVEWVKASSSIARIEGKLEAVPKTVRIVVKPKAPPIVKESGVFN